MAIEIWEGWQSGDGSVDVRGGSSSGDLIWIVRGAANQAEALAAAMLKVPAVNGDLVLDGVDVTRIGRELYQVAAAYRDPEQLKKDAQSPGVPGTIEKSFDTSGGSAHITHSLKTRQIAGRPGKAAPSFEQAINVKKDGDRLSVEGVDIHLPALALTYKKTFAAPDVTDAFIQTLAYLSGTVNAAVFHGYQPGELLFVGASGTQPDSDAPVDVTYRWLASANVSALKIGGLNTVDKRGWDYLWVLFEPVEDAAANSLAARPMGAYVEQVYREADWSGLKI